MNRGVMSGERLTMKYSGVGLKTCSANTKANDANVFSPPDRLAIGLQLFLGGMMERTTPEVSHSPI